MPKEPIIIRLFTPDNTIAEFEQLMTGEDGSFHHFLMEWDKPTTNLPGGVQKKEKKESLMSNYLIRLGCLLILYQIEQLDYLRSPIQRLLLRMNQR